MSKLKSWSAIGGSGAHTYRTQLTPNADPDRLKMNVTGVGTKGDVLGDVRNRVGAVTQTHRKNAVLALEFMLSASPEFFQGKSQTDIKAWAKANAAWLQAKFGKANLVHMVLHQDETTPHLVAYVVPEKGGKLNARGYTGSAELLSQLQTSYADAMHGFGLQRGIEGSHASNTTLKKWYGKLNAAVQQLDVPDMAPPPELSAWSLPGVRQAAVDAWWGQEKGVRQQLVQAAANAAVAASYARSEVADLKQENGKLHKQVMDLRDKLSAAYESLGLTKEDITALRKSNTSLVAQRLGFTGEIGKKENAIDLLKRVAEFDYSQAVAWLYAEFGPVVVGAVVKTAVEQEKPPRPFTRTENAIKKVVDLQLDALDSGKYRITLMSYDDSKAPFLPGKRGSVEHFYTKEELISLIPFMRYQNNQGMNVLLTPMDDEQYYIVLDDTRLDRAELEEQGFRPCLYQATSWASSQAVFKVPKQYDRNAVLAVSQVLNRQHGDPEMQALRQPIRLAGFRNMKPKHLKEGLYPFVKLIKAANTMCERCIRMVRKVELSTKSTGPSTERKIVI